MGRTPIHSSGPMSDAERQRRSRQRRAAQAQAALPAALSTFDRAQLIHQLSLLGSPSAVARATAAARAVAILKRLHLSWDDVIK
jgi:hypothetical protein